MNGEKTELTGAIAIIGMAGRFPGAANVAEFWRNLAAGVESITRFSDADLEVPGPYPPNYVRARPILDGIDRFDASFFGIYAKEAELMDPQQRVLLECAWEAFEEAGYDPARVSGTVGVFAGSSPSTYFLQNVAASPDFLKNYTAQFQVGNYTAMLGASTDFLATRVAYKLDLKGPAFTLHTGCSTSLVAVCQGVESLLAGQCDMALAGGVSITVPERRGYAYEEGGMVSPDGHCRAFDAAAQGTVFGSGAGVVLLKRYEDAVADGDHIHAVIRGCAVNNDGATKAGFTAPSVEGQARVITMAQAMAGVEPDSISYVEGHGTGTPLGDPIEVAALTQAFREGTEAKNFCVLGSAKTNVGHLDAASGVAGLIKTILALEHELLPGTLHFSSPNPAMNLEASPFLVSANARSWPRTGTPRRAGVSSFGVGGTNAHAVVEEAPLDPIRETHSSRPDELLVVSARSEQALDEATRNLAQWLRQHEHANLGDVAFTLQSGRRHFAVRRSLVAKDSTSAAAALEAGDSKRVFSFPAAKAALRPAFLFPGQGSQYPAMGRGLYNQYSVFRASFDRCAEVLQAPLGFDLRGILMAADDSGASAALLRQTSIAQPALLAIEYSLAQLWAHWGLRPQAMIGHSLGEFTAACLAGVFGIEDALGLISERARLMASLPPGGMLAVRTTPQELLPLLNGSLSLAAINGPQSLVASGPLEAITRLERELEGRRVPARRLETSHAFHSSAMDPITGTFNEVVRRVRLSEPKIPFVSGLTGRWITAEEATDPGYWARHSREPVEFMEGIRQLLDAGFGPFVEVGPGTVLAASARQCAGHIGQRAQGTLSIYPSLQATGEVHSMLSTLGRLWGQGFEPDWRAADDLSARRRVSLPTYPFERKRFWIEPQKTSGTGCEEVQKKETMATFLQESAAPNRLPQLVEKVQHIIEELSGIPAAELSPSATFLELGFDSLFLTQASQAVQSGFKLKVTFRQLLDDLCSIDRLAGHLDATLPAEPAAAPQVPVAPQAPEDQTAELTKLLARSLELLRHTGNAPAVPPAPTGAPSPEFKTFGPYKPIQKGTSGALTARQEAWLATLTARYTKRTHESKRLTERHRPVLADPRVAAGFRSQWKELVYPIVTIRSAGSKLWDVDGNEYIDLLNGFGPILFGHAPEFVTEAISKQLSAGFEIGPLTPLAGEVAELVSELTGMERVAFSNTGSEAVMAALRVARTVTGRNKVITFAGDYHGNFDEVLLKTVNHRSMPVAPGIPPEMVANMIVLEYGAPASLEYIRAHAHEVAAVLAEPVQSRHPDLRPIEFLREIRQITQKTETALIFDEVVSGFRVHPGGVQALFGIRADMVTYGKVAGGGMPIGILAGSPKFMDALDGGMWNYGDDSFPEVGVTFFAGTFVRHPLALAAARAVLTRIKEAGPSLQESLNRRTTEFVGRINAIFEEYKVPSRIANFGSYFYFSLPQELRMASLMYYLLREKGVHLQEGFPCFLTTAHSDRDLDQVVRAFRESVAEMQAGEALPTPARLAEPIRIPLTEPQKEIWLAVQLGDEASCAFNESVILRLEGALDEPALRRAFQALTARHEALRFRFDPGGEFVLVDPPREISMPLSDWSACGGSVQQSRLAEMISEEGARPLDLCEGPMFRNTLVRFGPESHALVFTAHHIAVDGWSMNVLFEELGQMYSAMRQGKQAALGTVISFADYAARQAAKTRTPEQAVTETWWLDEFATVPSPLDLPTDRPRPEVRTNGGATVRVSIEAEACMTLRKAGAAEGCTLFATLLSGFAALTHRLTGQDDIVIGIPAAAQSLEEGGSLVGHCVNFLPLRSRLVESATAAGFLRQSKQTLLRAFERQEYTYGSLLKKLALPRNPGRLPLIEIQFNVERVGTRLSFHGLAAELDANPKRFVNTDLFLNIVDTGKDLILDCDYNSDLFDETTIRRWLDSYRNILSGMAAEPSAPVSRLPLFSASGRAGLLEAWKGVVASYDREAGVHELVERRADQTPHAIAAVFEGSELTYRELDERANRLARWLRRLGVGRETLVGVALGRSNDMLVSLLAVLKAGGAYVPLDPEYPADRLAYILETTEAAVVLTEERLAAGLAVRRARVVCIDSEREPIARESAARLGRTAAGGDLAYVIFTSGSTGRPKGVEISHRSLVNLLESMRREPGFAAGDRLVAVTTLSFDIAGLELFLPLVAGARTIVASRDQTRDGELLLGLLAESGATALQATPATWRMLLEAGWTGEPRLKMLCGGEALPRELAERLLRTGGELWNLYGPTETTIWSSAARVETGEGPVPLGRPVANTQFRVLDRNLEPASAGVIGELYIAGDGLARGYFRQPELTADRFIPDPFRVQDTVGERAGSRMYKTGDLVRYRADGRLEFLGRLDHQVKVRGFRIELGEIEAALLKHLAVKEAVALARDVEGGDKRLIAWFACHPGEAMPEIEDLRALLQRSLPGYMQPSAIVPLPALPRMPNGKVDTRSLAATALEAGLGSREIVPPRTAREKRLAQIWAETLHLDEIGVTTSIFELGGDSLVIFRTTMMARKAGFHFTPRDVFQYRTIAALSSLDEQSAGSPSKAAPVAAPVITRAARDARRASRLSL